MLNYHIGRFVLNLMRVRCDSAMVVSRLPAEAQPHPNSNMHQIKNKTANVVVQQHQSQTPEDGHSTARTHVEPLRSKIKSNT